MTDCEHTMLKGQSTMVFPLASLVGVVFVIIWVIRADAGHRGRAATDLTKVVQVLVEEHDTGLAALTVDRDLPGSVALGEIAPAQARLRRSAARLRRGASGAPVAGRPPSRDRCKARARAGCARRTVLDRGRFEDLAEVDAQIAGLLAKGEQGFESPRRCWRRWPGAAP